MADERREDELPPDLQCTCRRGPTDSGIHDMGCLLRAQVPRTSDPNVLPADGVLTIDESVSVKGLKRVKRFLKEISNG